MQIFVSGGEYGLNIYSIPSQPSCLSCELFAPAINSASGNCHVAMPMTGVMTVQPWSGTSRTTTLERLVEGAKQVRF